MQTICSQHGPLKTFYFNKSATQALACFVNADDALSARNALNMAQFSNPDGFHCTADILPADTIPHILANGQPGAWVQLPPSVGMSNVAPAPSKSRNAYGGGSGIWSPSDTM
jgi:hypothetical protein